jgi:two-component system response regulator DesR
MNIEVIIAEHQAMVLGALAALLAAEDDIEVVGQARNVHEPWSRPSRYNPRFC